MSTVLTRHSCSLDRAQHTYLTGDLPANTPSELRTLLPTHWAPTPQQAVCLAAQQVKCVAAQSLLVPTDHCSVLHTCQSMQCPAHVPINSSGYTYTFTTCMSMLSCS